LFVFRRNKLRVPEGIRESRGAAIPLLPTDALRWYGSCPRFLTCEEAHTPSACRKGEKVRKYLIETPYIIVPICHGFIRGVENGIGAKCPQATFPQVHTLVDFRFYFEPQLRPIVATRICSTHLCHRCRFVNFQKKKTDMFHRFCVENAQESDEVASSRVFYLLMIEWIPARSLSIRRFV
jgi:hypothetical protein